MSSENSYIKLNNVCLDYLLKTGSVSLRKHILQLTNKILGRPVDETIFNSTYRGLNNISLEINRGDKIGIFGLNGAGKSTLLRVLAGIYKPNIGTIDIQGHPSCLFDISLGLDLEATGYENILALCTLKGINKQEAYSIATDVAAFAELGDFFYKPVRMYSAGMCMKLAFGVATAGNPDILLVDEVIGVGDAKFLHKATRRIENLLHSSNILVLTSHDSSIIKKFCNKALILDRGNMIFYGDVNAAIDKYNKILSTDKPETADLTVDLIDNQAEMEPV